MATRNFNLSTYPTKINLARMINEKSIANFKIELSNTKTQNANKSYNFFLTKFSTIYEKHFPLKEITRKTKNLISPWITSGITKSSKQKQKLYIKGT